MSTKNYVLGAVICALTSVGAARADDDITGTLRVPSRLEILDKKGKLRVLEAGEHRLNLDMDGSPGKQEVKLNFKDAEGKKRKAVLSVPAGVTLPKSGGSVTVPRAATGQAFDLVLGVSLAHSDGPQFKSTEDCNCQPDIKECDLFDPNDCEIYEGACGWQVVTYHYQETVVTSQASFETGASSAPDWKGTRSFDTLITDDVGPCHGP
jgi:hypothetical protein